MSSLPPPSNWLVLAAAEVEVAALRRALKEAGARVPIVVAGVGRAGDEPARQALARGHGPVLQIGFAGGLGAAAGEIVLTTDWLDAEGGREPQASSDPDLRRRLGGWLSAARLEHTAALGISVDAPFHDPVAGAALAAQGARTVEMEGAQWARLAHAAGRPLAALRVISDGADLRLIRPRHLVLRPDGGLRLGRWLAAVLGAHRAGVAERTPHGEWRALRRAQREWQKALASLAVVSDAVAAHLGGRGHEAQYRPRR